MSPAKKSAGRKATSKSSRSTRSAGSKKTSARAAGKTPKKTAARKTAAKKTPKKTAARKTAAKKTPKKTAARKTAAKKTPKKTAAKRTPAKKSGGKTGRARSTKKPAAPKPVMNRPPVPKKRVRPAKLDKKILASIREKLASDKSDLEAQLEEIERDSITESEDTGLHEDFADAGTSTFERERDLSIRNNVLDLLDQVTRAIARIDEGGYGTCENCGQPIDAARIKAFPRVLMCLDCKRRDERTR